MTMNIAGPSSNSLLPLESPLEPLLLVNEGTDAARESQLFSFLDHPRYAAKLTCLDARRLQLLSSRGGLRLFRHRLRPVVFVHLVGRVVGIEEREKRVAWLVDDGSSVIAVHHFFRQSAPSPSMQIQRRSPRQNGKGKERQIDDVSCGIPLEYLLPPPPPLPQRRQQDRVMCNSSNRKTVNVSNYFQIGDVVSIVGRIDLWMGREERIVNVERVLQKDRNHNFEREDHEGYIELIVDPNEEPRHLLSALLLSAAEYSKPFQSSAISIEEESGQAFKVFNTGEILSSQKLRGAEPQKSTREKSQRKLRVMESEPGKRTVTKPDRLHASACRPISIGLTNIINSQRDGGEEKSVIAKEVLSNLPVSISSNDKIGPIRHLRHYTKLPDSKLTESTFRVYVEKYLLDHCSTSTLDDCSREASVGKGRKRTGYPGCTVDARQEPPAFTLKYLQRVTILSDHARRTVEVGQRRREEKKLRKETKTRGDQTSKSRPVVVASNEKVNDKMERLYACVLRAMMMDGIIVLASPDIQLKQSFKKRSSPSRTASQGSDIVQKKPVIEHEYWRAPMHEEAYQVITPALLASPILEAISLLSRGTVSSQQVVERLQYMDDRWRFIRQESIEEGLQYLKEGVM